MAASTFTLSALLALLGASLVTPLYAQTCDLDLDLCDVTTTLTSATSTTPTTSTLPTVTEVPSKAGRVHGSAARAVLLASALALSRSGGAASPLIILLAFAGSWSTAAAAPYACSDVKSFYRDQSCCGNPSQALAGATPDWACTSPVGVCACERMRTALAGVPGAMFPADFCADFAHLKPVGHRSATICEASDAGTDADLLRDGYAGNINWPHGMIKVLATVGEVNPRTGAMLTGVPDGNGVYLKDADTVRYIYQSESYGPLTRQETFPFFVNTQVGVTGSHIHFIDFNRSMLATYFDAGAPANAESMILDSGEAVLRMYNLEREEVGRRGSTTSARPHHSNVNLAGEYIVAATPTKADWLMQSLCSAHLSVKYQWGTNLGVQDDLFVTNEEWIMYTPDAVGIVGLPAHVLNLATHELWAVSTFGLGGFEKIVEVNTGSATHVAFVPSGYNGAFGGSFPAVVQERNANYTRTDGNPYVWPQNIVPTRLYVGWKNKDKDGNADSTSFLARNGFDFGAMYGFATDCSAGTPGAEGRDAWHRNTATAGATVTGAFYKLRWRDQPGKAVDFVDDYAWEFQDAPEGAPAGWCFWNGNGKDSSGSKTEHVSPDPRGGLRVLQGSTAGYLGIYDFSGLTDLLAAGGALPASIPATYTCLQPESDIRSQIVLGGGGLYADGQDATVNPDRGQNPGKATFEDIDALDWHAAANGEDYFIIHEDSGNDFGERKFLAKVGVPMEYYYVAMSGGVRNSRQLAGVSAVEGVMKDPAGHEFSGSTDLSGFLAKNADGSFKLSAGDATGAARRIAAEVPVNEKSFVVSLQAHSNWGGWTESFSPDAVGQILIYKPAVPTR